MVSLPRVMCSCPASFPPRLSFTNVHRRCTDESCGDEHVVGRGKDYPGIDLHDVAQLHYRYRSPIVISCGLVMRDVDSGGRLYRTASTAYADQKYEYASRHGAWHQGLTAVRQKEKHVRLFHNRAANHDALGLSTEADAASGQKQRLQLVIFAASFTCDSICSFGSRSA